MILQYMSTWSSSDSLLVVFPGYCWITVSLGAHVGHALGLTMSLRDLCILNGALGFKVEICQHKSLQPGRQPWIPFVSQVFWRTQLWKKMSSQRHAELSPSILILCQISALQCLMSQTGGWVPPDIKHNGLCATLGFHLLWVKCH